MGLHIRRNLVGQGVMAQSLPTNNNSYRVSFTKHSKHVKAKAAFFISVRMIRLIHIIMLNSHESLPVKPLRATSCVSGKNGAV